MSFLRILISIALAVICYGCKQQADQSKTESLNESSNIAEYLLSAKDAVHALSEREFAGKIRTEAFTDSIELLFGDYKQALFASKIDSSKLPTYSDMFDPELAFEFVKDTLWLQECHNAMFLIGLNDNTYEMMQTNKYCRELSKRLVYKYYRKFLSALTDEDQAKSMTAHEKWQESIDADYDLANDLARKRGGSMQFYTWSREVDELLLHRAIYYYEMYQYKTSSD